MGIPKKIGFHVPYTWDDSTYMACSLADFATLCGLPVSILSSQSHDTNIHHRWDHLAMSGKRHNYSLWQSECSHLIWFDVQKAKVEESRREGRTNIFVPLWHRLTPDQVDCLDIFDCVVATHVELFNRLKDQPCSLIYCPWDCGLPFATDTMPSETRRVYVPIDSFTAKHHGTLLLNTLRMVLDFDDDTMFTIGYSKNWDQVALRSLGGLIRAHPRRIRAIKKPSHAERIEAYQRHDWVFIPSLRENAGLFALESLACRKPVVCFDCQPHRELLTNGVNARLIPCELDYHWLKVPEVVVNSHDLAEQLKLLVENPSIVQEMTAQPWPKLQEWRDAFAAQWRLLWELD